MNYQLQIVNNSAQAGSFVIYQSQRDPNLSTLAWQAKYAYPSTVLNFSWALTQNLIWSSTGQLSPGVVLQVGQALAATNESNQITLSYDLGNHAFFFHNQTQAQQQGVFMISLDSSIPPVGAVSVGIGLDGKPTFMIQGMPNMNCVFTPAPLNTYWVAFTEQTQQGSVVVTDTLNPVEVQFPPNVDSMTVTLNADMTWTVQPNVLLLKAEEI